MTNAPAPALPTVDELALLGVPATVAEGIRRYIDALNDADAGMSMDRGFTHGGKLDGLYRTHFFAVDPKQTSAGKYLRILALDVHQGVIGGKSGRGGSMHAFVNKATGEVSKPAGMNGPAKSTAKATKGQVIVRFSVTDDVTTWPTFDPFGSYLYSR